MEQELQALRDQIIQMQGQLQTQQNALQAIPQVPQAIQVQGPANQVKPD